MQWTQEHLDTVRSTTFPERRGGYHVTDVDTYLDHVLACMTAKQQIPDPVPLVFPASPFRAGYDQTKVDALLFVLKQWHDDYGDRGHAGTDQERAEWAGGAASSPTGIASSPAGVVPVSDPDRTSGSDGASGPGRPDRTGRADGSATTPAAHSGGAAEPEASGGHAWTQAQQDWVRDAAFPKAKGGRVGYLEGDVDDFLDRVLVAMGHGEAIPDVDSARFGRSSRFRAGYDAEAVDIFLDQLAQATPGGEVGDRDASDRAGSSRVPRDNDDIEP